MKTILSLIVVGSLVIFGWMVFDANLRRRAYQPPEIDASINHPQPPETTVIRLIAVGDMLPHDTVNLRAQTDSGYDYLPFFDQIDSIFSSSDLAFCNQEAPSAGEVWGISGYPSFNAPEAFARDLSTLGCNLVNLANNHVADKGTGALEATVRLWQGLESYAINGANPSADEQQVSYFNFAEKRFAFVSFAQFSNNTAIPSYSINLLDETLVRNMLQQARANADYVIVSAHWGQEYSAVPDQTQEYYAQIFVEEKADLVLGSGPHVLQPVETKSFDNHQTIIWYSLGNLLSTQLEIDQLIGGAAILDLTVAPDGIETTLKGFIPTYMHYEWSQTEAEAGDMLARHNLKIYPLAKAQDYIEASLFSTTVDEQLQRVQSILNQRQTVPILTLDEL